MYSCKYGEHIQLLLVQISIKKQRGLLAKDFIENQTRL